MNNLITNNSEGLQRISENTVMYMYFLPACFFVVIPLHSSVYNMRASEPASHASQHVSQHASHASHASQHKITLFLT